MMGDEAERLSEQGDIEEAYELSSMQIGNERNKKHESNKSAMFARFSVNTKAEIGCTMCCAYCNRLILKKNKYHRFCGKKYKKSRHSSCKDSYHNYTNIKREIC